MFILLVFKQVEKSEIKGDRVDRKPDFAERFNVCAARQGRLRAILFDPGFSKQLCSLQIALAAEWF